MDRKEFEQKYLGGDSVKLELGCGPFKSVDGAISIDILNEEGVDIVFDLSKGLPFIPDNSVDYIFSRHFLEHIGDVDFLIREIHRVLKPGGTKELIVPHHKNPHYYSDLTHKSFYGLYTFDYYGTEETMLKRKVPAFYNHIKFDIVLRKLEFRSRFWLIQFHRRIFTKIVNSSSWFQEFYEGVLSNRVPCSEIRFILKKSKS